MQTHAPRLVREDCALTEECVLLAIASEAAGKWLARGSPPSKSSWRVCGRMDPTQGHEVVRCAERPGRDTRFAKPDAREYNGKAVLRGSDTRSGITECRNTEFDIRWKCSKVIRVAKLNGFRNLRTQQRALSQCHFFGDGSGIFFLVCFLFFPLIDGSCGMHFVCVVGVCR